MKSICVYKIQLWYQILKNKAETVSVHSPWPVWASGTLSLIILQAS